VSRFRASRHQTWQENPWVSIFCDASSHEVRWWIASFVFSPPRSDTWPGGWIDSSRYINDAGTTLGVRPVGDDPEDQGTSWTLMRGNEPVSRHEVSHGTRLRFRFHCERCGLTAVARSERLYGVFDTLAEQGLRSISLGALGARLRSTERRRDT